MDTTFPPCLTPQQARGYSPLALAFIGDAVYEEFIRAKILLRANMSANKLHREAVKFVKASAQSSAMKALMPLLTEEEEEIFKRGRNAHSASVPKNADVTEYRAATGFEALIGYLYLTARQERLQEVMLKAFEAIVENK
ncbi:MAG: Mini-ribonuclease 3 [Ruminococcaceae bacterium]|nr:Mini-ribonuclease 3 [Oscillospiraceae bacterium]